MKQFLSILALAGVLIGASAPGRAHDAYDDSQSHPLRSLPTLSIRSGSRSSGSSCGRSTSSSRSRTSSGSSVTRRTRRLRRLRAVRADADECSSRPAGARMTVPAQGRALSPRASGRVSRAQRLQARRARRPLPPAPARRSASSTSAPGRAAGARLRSSASARRAGRRRRSGRDRSVAGPNVTSSSGDVTDRGTIEAAVARLGSQADVVLSDLAPKLTGVRATDEARSAELVEGTLAALPILLRPGGRLLAKLFMSAGYSQAVRRCDRRSPTCRTTAAAGDAPGIVGAVRQRLRVPGLRTVERCCGASCWKMQNRAGPTARVRPLGLPVCAIRERKRVASSS